MFLKELNEKQQEIFLNLSYTLICADNVISENEKRKLEMYSEELGHHINLDSLKVVSIREAVLSMGELPTVLKRKVYFELMAMAQADFDYGSNEKVFMQELQHVLDIEDKIAERIKNTVIKLLEAYIEMNSYFREK